MTFNVITSEGTVYSVQLTDKEVRKLLGSPKGQETLIMVMMGYFPIKR